MSMMSLHGILALVSRARLHKHHVKKTHNGLYSKLASLDVSRLFMQDKKYYNKSWIDFKDVCGIYYTV